MPGKIIKVATGKQSLSVVGECTVGNVKDKNQRKRAFPLEWDSEKSKKNRRHRFEDDEEAFNWFKRTTIPAEIVTDRKISLPNKFHF